MIALVIVVVGGYTAMPMFLYKKLEGQTDTIDSYEKLDTSSDSTNRLSMSNHGNESITLEHEELLARLDGVFHEIAKR